TWRQLRGAFRSGAVAKQYLALVCGAAGNGGSEQPLAQRGNHVAVDPLGLPASTRWQVVERFAAHTLLRCTAETGRMHQVRAHLAAAGTPVAGDTLYGGAPLPGLIAHFLHAARVDLHHPRTGQPLIIEAPLPPDRTAAIAAARSL
ncbi:MAG TPA: pseudouridine synthase, partial [Kofleriaceae bacterium]|nr:pseudouridine synthase [Kofleriaceae bacterium]